MLSHLRKAVSKNLSIIRAVEKSMPWLWRLRGHRHVSDASPVIVGGCPRSGTTLLRMMLDSHREICCGPETRIFCGKRLKIARLSHKCDIPPKEIAELLWSSRSRYEFIELFLDAYARAAGKRRWAEKTPKNVFALRNVFEHFPNARFIHMLRDGRDVVCSLRTHPKFALKKGKLVANEIQRSPKRCAEIWSRSVAEGLKWRGDKRYREVRYEDLVADPEQALRELFEWLQEPWDPAVLAFHEVKTPSRQPEKNAGNPEANRPVDRHSTGRWRKSLNAEERVAVNAVCGDLLRSLGYSKDASWMDEEL